MQEPHQLMNSDDRGLTVDSAEFVYLVPPFTGVWASSANECGAGIRFILNKS